MTAPFDPSIVSSLTEVLAGRVGRLTGVPATEMPLWLPQFTMPDGWKVQPHDDARVTQMSLRQLHEGGDWDACEVLNLYRAPGAVPEALVLEHADLSLRDSHAYAIRTERVDIPAGYDVVGTRASGIVRLGVRPLHVHYTYFGVNAPAGGALIEQVILVVGHAYAALIHELNAIDRSLRHALLTSIDSAQLPGNQPPLIGVPQRSAPARHHQRHRP